MTNNKYVNDILIGSFVNSIKSWIGTWLAIRLSEYNVKYRLLIYMTDWSITDKENIEILSSDLSDNIHEFKFDDFIPYGTKISDIEIIDEREFHIELENGVTVEIWIDPEDGRYSLGSEMVLFYRDGELISKIFAGSVSKDLKMLK